MFEKGSTAVLSTPELPFVVAVKKAGIYSFIEGEWFLEYSLSHNIYKLVQIGSYIFGIGDNGTIIRYNSNTRRWVQTSFPTNQRLWDITGNEHGLIVTHGGSKLYISHNFGMNWSILKPFESFSKKPMIRSLFYHHDSIYIGTQINRENGGLWKYCLTSGELLLEKNEKQAMISSIHIDKNGCVYVSKGNGCLGEGTIEMKAPHIGEWQSFGNLISEKAFLDIFVVNDKLYATSSKNHYGFSRIYEICKDKMSLSPIETIEGHGFRGAGFEDQFFISSPVESKWICNPYEKPKLFH